MSKRKKKKDPTVTPDSPHGDHIEFATDVLNDALALLRPILLKRAIRKDLASFLFRAEKGGKVTVSASDERVRLQLRVEALAVVGLGVAMIDAHALTALMGAYGEPRIRVHLSEVGGSVAVEGLKAKLKLPAYDPEKEMRSPIPGCLTQDGWLFGADELRAALALVRQFVDEDSTRYALGGVCLVMPEGDEPATLVATNGRCLAQILVDVTRHGQPERIWRPGKEREGATGGLPVLPNKAVKLAEHIARRQPGGRVAIAVIPGEPIDLEKGEFKPGKLQVVTKEAVVTCDVVEGRFPVYTEVWPTGEIVSEVVLPRASKLNDLVKIAAANTNSESRGVELTFSGGCVMLMSESNTKGKAQSFLTEVEMTGKDTVTLDALMFRQILDVLGDRPLTVRTYGPKEAVVFSSGLDWTGCLMPLTSDRSDGPTRPVGPIHEEMPEADEPGYDPEDQGNAPEGWQAIEGDDPLGDGYLAEIPVVVEPIVPVASEPDAHKGNGHAKPARKRKR